MIYVVGDIHGEINKLVKLINYIKLVDITPEFIFIGDYIDKGEDAKKTLEFLIEFRSNFKCTFLIGNHEYCWLNAEKYSDYLLKYGGLSTINSFKSDSVISTQELLLNEFKHFFEVLVPYIIIDDYFISHSGISMTCLDQNLELLSTDNFIFNRYDFISSSFLYKNKYKFIFGHTGFYKPYVDKYKIGIDTAACFLENQPLTCYCLENEMFYNSDMDSYSIKSLYNELYCPNIIRNKPWRM